MKTICVISCPALLDSVRLRLGAQLNQLSHIRYPIESGHQIAHAPRSVMSDDGFGVGQELGFNLSVAHRIVRGSAGVLDKSSVPPTTNMNHFLCLVAAERSVSGYFDPLPQRDYGGVAGALIRVLRDARGAVDQGHGCTMIDAEFGLKTRVRSF